MESVNLPFFYYLSNWLLELYISYRYLDMVRTFVCVLVRLNSLRVANYKPRKYYNMVDNITTVVIGFCSVCVIKEPDKITLLIIDILRLGSLCNNINIKGSDIYSVI